MDLTNIFRYYMKNLSLLLAFICSTLNICEVQAQQLESSKITPTSPFGGSISSYKVSPDGAYIVYKARFETESPEEFFSIPAQGGTPVRLNRRLTSSGQILREFEISPDSSTVIYTGTQDNIFSTEIYSVPITGATASNGIVKLNTDFSSPFGAGLLQQRFEISPDSKKVVFSHTDTLFQYSLFSNDLRGGNLVELDLNVPRQVQEEFDFRVSSDSNHVVYTFEATSASQPFHIYKTLIGSNTSTKVTSVAQSQSQQRFSLSPDGSRVVFTADNNADNQYKFYSNSLSSNSASIELNNLSAPGRFSFSFRVTPDGSNVVFIGPTPGLPDVKNVFALPITGGSLSQLSNAVTASTEAAQIEGFTRDSSRVIYDTAGRFPSLMASSIIDGSDSSITVPAAPSGGQSINRISNLPGGEKIKFSVKGREPGALDDVYTANLTGGGLTKLNADSKVANLAENEAGAVIAYTTNDQLVITPTAAFEPQTVNIPSGASGGTEIDSIIFNGDALFFRSNAQNAGSFELYRVELPTLQGNDGDFCIPVKACNQKVAVICL